MGELFSWKVLVEILVLALIFLGAILGYFRVAQRYNIIDKPNERSSHTTFTIRGAGLLFVVAFITWFIRNEFALPWFALGFAIISLVSFIDDIKPLPVRMRLPLHLLSVGLLLHQLQIFHHGWLIVLVLAVLVVGTLNAYNFMDGINGITGLYTLSILIPLALFNPEGVYSDYPSLFYYLATAILVFGVYNFRKKARCFAGDVGSMSLAYVVLFLVICMIRENWELKYVLLLAVYGVDTVLTILHRLMLKENIFKAHRKHLYQYLSNELKMPHVLVACIYAVIQLLINIWVLKASIGLVEEILILGILSILYILLKYAVVAGKLRPVGQIKTVSPLK